MSGDDPAQRVLDLLDEVSDTLTVKEYIELLEEVADDIRSRLEAAREDAAADEEGDE